MTDNSDSAENGKQLKCEVTKTICIFCKFLSAPLPQIKKEIIFLLMARRNLWPFTYGDFFWYERWFVVCLKHVEKIIRKHSRRRQGEATIMKKVETIPCHAKDCTLGTSWRPRLSLLTGKELYVSCYKSTCSIIQGL